MRKWCNGKGCQERPIVAFRYVFGNGPIYKITHSFYCLGHMKEFKGELGEDFIVPHYMATDGQQPRHKGVAVGPVFDNDCEAADFWNDLVTANKLDFTNSNSVYLDRHVKPNQSL